MVLIVPRNRVTQAFAKLSTVPAGSLGEDPAAVEVQLWTQGSLRVTLRELRSLSCPVTILPVVARLPASGRATEAHLQNLTSVAGTLRTEEKKADNLPPN
jgi:hypothetical protein